MGNTGKNSNVKNNQRKSQKKKNQKARKIIKLIGYILCAIQFVFSILATLYVVKLNIVPTSYIVIIDVLLLVLVVFFILLQKWPVPGVIASFLSIIISSILFLGCFYINFTYKKIRDMSGVDTKIDNVNVYVRADDAAGSINDAANYNFGILTELDRENTNNIIADIESAVGQSISITEYDTVLDLVQGLFENQTQ
ncbi:MAG: hypothetical protein IJ054_05700, partial [Lachnospiraceae bacterium]|nr:hypothetical protein [Lachnospiraceae bacterium]